MFKIARLVTPLVLLSACTMGNNNNNSTSNNGTTTTTTKPVTPKPAPQNINTTYRILSAKDSIKHIQKYFSAPQLLVLEHVNRVDSAHIASIDSILVPQDISGDAGLYTPFPASVPYLRDIDKIIFFSYTDEYFGAYENGTLVRTGPTNMGRETDTTPTGLHFTNWKAEETHSTFNDEWDLKWNFNIENKEGIGFHEYAMPGYPASHSCLRLTSDDAQFLYNWADEWILKGKSDIEVQGTPVIVFGSYPFGQAKPWLQLASDAHALDIKPEQLQSQVQPYKDSIMANQQKRAVHPRGSENK